jgi:hypothetical protein
MNATTNAIAIAINITNIKNIAPRFYTVFIFSKPFSPNLSLSGSAESLKWKKNRTFSVGNILNDAMSTM